MNPPPFCCIVPTDKLDVVGILIKPDTTASTILTSCAAKLPDASRATKVLGVFDDVPREAVVLLPNCPLEVTVTTCGVVNETPKIPCI